MALTLVQLASILMQAVGPRGGQGGQAPTVALGYRDNWGDTLFFAKQGGPISEDMRGRLLAQCASNGVHNIVDARAYAAAAEVPQTNYGEPFQTTPFMKSGLGTASAHAEMLVLTAMLHMRIDRAAGKSSTVPKYTQEYVEDRIQKRRQIDELAAKFGHNNRRVRIVANAQTCHFCANMLDMLQLEWGGLDPQGRLLTARGPKPNTGWWNPILDKGYGHGMPEWSSNVPGL